MRSIDYFTQRESDDRKLSAGIRRDSEVERIYGLYPKLREFDNEILSIRGRNLIRAIDHMIDPGDVISAEEEELRAKRRAYIEQEGIDPSFDEEKVECTKCGDTGFIIRDMGSYKLRLVCDCMKEAAEAAYDEAGLADYSLIRPEAFSADYIKRSEKKRKEADAFLCGKDGAIVKTSAGKPGDTYYYFDGAQTGKTFLAIRFVKLSIRFGLKAAYVKLDDLYKNGFEKRDDYKECDILVIDDFSSASTKNNAVASNLNYILESRKANNRFTLIVSCESIEEAVSKSDERIAAKISRITVI